MNFRMFFAALWSDAEPFPWQEELAERVLADGWPEAIGLPTAAGKTAVIDIAVFALAARAQAAARRIFFVVDRRVIVDEASERANKISARLAEAKPGSPLWDAAESLRNIGGDAERPLETSRLRGGIPRDNTWTASPLQPIVISSTVDQIGSALLFRAYDATEYARPIHAALSAFDSVIILDEVHISQPFAQTLGRIRQYATWANKEVARPLQVVEMSATPRIANVLRETEADRNHPILHARWFAEKRAELVIADNATGESASENGFSGLIDGVARQALRMRDEHGARVIGVIANRVRTARAVHAALRQEAPDGCVLLTGRARPWDRDRIWQEWRGRMELGRPADFPAQPVFVVATQCIEAGANLDFDALVTECASVDALEQRFGRLNRAGKLRIARAAILAQKDQTASRYEDAVYGKSVTATWAWLRKREQSQTLEIAIPAEGKKKPRTKEVKETWVPMGTVVLREALDATENRRELVVQRPDAPVLMPAHVDLLCQTSPEPAVSPEPAIFLHGPASGPADVQVIWRADLGDDPDAWADTVAVCPPAAAEAISLPVWAVRSWLTQAKVGDVSDLEGGQEPAKADSGASRPALCWVGADESKVLDAADVRPAMTLVVPSSYGGCDEWGWNPESEQPVRDVGDAVKLRMNRPILRLHEGLAAMWDYSALAERLRDPDITIGEATEVLRSAATPHDLIEQIVGSLLSRRARRLIPGLAVVGKAGFDQAGERSSHTDSEQLLSEHLTGCKHFAERFSPTIESDVRECIARAAELHDIGKADPRFQAWLRGGNPVRPFELIAKSARSGQNSAAIDRARRAAGYPKGARHELASVALLNGSECDLVLHLIASHHGRCRPFAPCIPDDDPVEIHYQGLVTKSDHRLERAGSGITERFWRLTREYGWYGLAYAETLLRLADHWQSEIEREDGESAVHA